MFAYQPAELLVSIVISENGSAPEDCQLSVVTVFLVAVVHPF